ncbi:hypothetical protein BDE40_2176 [Litoreibacter halocynthiae]|uniref:Mannitol repressor n=1 Tax=Litoreibacter halocynthiae TaxID=1242689 RepID=A0A4V6Q3A3_9RHOB|nr:hypothetical protein [Litoreibacter halocynthiae]TDT75445.1 hypothetical protein BDE40_2176 [Litoreibacter halocynthiae]
MSDWMKHLDRLPKILDAILDESERGAVLLSCHIIDDFLMEMIKTHKAEGVSQKVLADTTGYGGAFGSLSMKSKALFVLGILTEQSFSAIEKLRGIRNKAAHSSQVFRISDHQERFDLAIKSFGDGGVNNVALNMAMHNFLEKMLAMGPDLESKMGRNPFPDQQSCVDYLAGNDDLTSKLQEQMPKWQVAILTHLIIETIALNFENYYKSPNA